MRKDKINQDALEKAYLIYAEHGHQIQDFAHKPTDYARGTVMEPEATSQLKSNFGEYDMLGERCEEICSEIDGLKESMKVARMRGNFQELQQQMKLINNLTKEKSAVEAKMATLDLSRQQDDSHKTMMGMEPSYSENINSVEAKIAELEAKLAEFAEDSGHPFDFTTCQRKDGSMYGTSGKCRKGSPTAAVREAMDKTYGREQAARKSGDTDTAKKEMRRHLRLGKVMDKLEKSQKTKDIVIKDLERRIDEAVTIKEQQRLMDALGKLTRG
jgi:hypothetical protein